MPHVMIDYSRLAGDRVDMPALTAAVHRALRDSGIVKPNGVRTLAREATISFVADEDPSNQFIQIVVRVAPGREASLRKRIVELVFSAAAAVARPALVEGRTGLRVDLTQSDSDFFQQENTLP